MTKVIAQNNELWALKKIQSLVGMEVSLIKKQLRSIQNKISSFERKYKSSDRESLYGQIDDMELIEWEGEIETMSRLKKRGCNHENS